MSEIIDRLERIINEVAVHRTIPPLTVKSIAQAIEAAMIPGYASCEQCGDGDCPDGVNACHIKGIYLKGRQLND